MHVHVCEYIIFSSKKYSNDAFNLKVRVATCILFRACTYFAEQKTPDEATSVKRSKKAKPKQGNVNTCIAPLSSFAYPMITHTPLVPGN